MEHLDKRVSRIIGQMKGIQKMVKEERECPQILQQVSAIKKAIDSLSKEIIMMQVSKVVPKEKVKELSDMIERSISL